MNIKYGMIVLIVILSIHVVTAGKNTGVDSILNDVGVDKPSEWKGWTMEQKFTFLQDMGLYPTYGNKYKGDTPDLTLYFAKLGTTQPENWFELSFEEKKAFVAEAKYKLDNPEPEVIEPKFAYTNYLKIILILITLAIGTSSFFPIKNKFKKHLRKFVYYILPIILIAMGIINPVSDLFKQMGHMAEYLLIGLLLVKPLAKITHSRMLFHSVNYRRETGVASFWLFFIHALGLIVIRSMYTLESYSQTFLIWGVGAGIGMSILALTSNNKSVRLLRHNWKKLQYIVYPVLLATLAHTSLSEFDNLNKFYFVGGIFVILKILEWTKFSFLKN